MTFGSIAARTAKQPIAWISAALYAGVGALEPSDWIAETALRMLAIPNHGLATVLFNERVLVDNLGVLLGTLIVSWLVQVPLLAATLATPKRSAFAILAKGASRLVRTRALSVVVTGAFSLIPVYVLSMWLKKSEDPSFVVPHFGLALIAMIAGGWMTLSDRFALVRFDARQDAIARQKREDGRASANSPYHLDTSNPRGGHGVATGADNAVTDGGWALLEGRSFVILAILGGLGVARATASIFVGRYVILPLTIVVAFASAVLWTWQFTNSKR